MSSVINDIVNEAETASKSDTPVPSDVTHNKIDPSAMVDLDGIQPDVAPPQEKIPLINFQINENDENEANELLEELEQEKKKEFRRIATESKDVDIKELTGSEKIAKRTGYSLDFVRRNYNAFQIDVDYDPDEVIKHDSVANFFLDPDNVALANKSGNFTQEVARMNEIANVYDGIRFNEEKRNSYVRDTVGSIWRGKEAAEASLWAAKVASDASSENIKNFSKAVNESRQASDPKKRSEAYLKSQEAINKETQDVGEEVEEFVEGFKMTLDGQISKGLWEMTKGASGTLIETFDVIGKTAFYHKAFVLNLTGENLANMLPGTAGVLAGAGLGAAAGSVIPGLGTAVGAGVGGIFGGIVGGTKIEQGAWIEQELARFGVDAGNAQELEQWIRANPEEWQGMIKRGFKKGIVTSGFDAAVDVGTLGLGKLFKAGKGAGKGVAKNVAKNVAKKNALDVAKRTLKHAGGEAAGEFAGQLAAHDKREPFNIAQATQESVLEALSSFGLSPATTAGAGAVIKKVKRKKSPKYSDDPVIAVKEIAYDVENAKRSANELRALEKQMNEFAQLEIKELSPSKAKKFLRQTYGDDAYVFVDKGFFDKTFDNPREEAKAVGAEKGYDTASKNNGTIAIPLSEYIARYAGTEHQDILLGGVRSRVDGLTIDETLGIIEDLPGLIEDIALNALDDDDAKESQKEGTTPVTETTDERGIVLQDQSPVVQKEGPEKVTATLAEDETTQTAPTLGTEPGVITIPPEDIKQLPKSDKQLPAPETEPDVITIPPKEPLSTLPMQEVVPVEKVEKSDRDIVLEDELKGLNRPLTPEDINTAADKRKAKPESKKQADTRAKMFNRIKERLVKEAKESGVAESMELTPDAIEFDLLLSFYSKMSKHYIDPITPEEFADKFYLGFMENSEINRSKKTAKMKHSERFIKQRIRVLENNRKLGIAEIEEMSVTEEVKNLYIQELNERVDRHIKAVKKTKRRSSNLGMVFQPLPSNFLSIDDYVLDMYLNPFSEDIINDLYGKKVRSGHRTIFFHESAHYFLNIMNMMALDPNVSEEFKKDFQVLKKTFKLRIGKEGQVHPTGHERFAEAFEQYMREGKAPNKSLESLFSVVRDWFLQLYKNLESILTFHHKRVLKEEISDDMRNAFDQMFDDLSNELNDKYNLEEKIEKPKAKAKKKTKAKPKKKPESKKQADTRAKMFNRIKKRLVKEAKESGVAENINLTPDAIEFDLLLSFYDKMSSYYDGMTPEEFADKFYLGFMENRKSGRYSATFFSKEFQDHAKKEVEIRKKDSIERMREAGYDEESIKKTIDEYEKQVISQIPKKQFLDNKIMGQINHIIYNKLSREKIGYGKDSKRTQDLFIKDKDLADDPSGKVKNRNVVFFHEMAHYFLNIMAEMSLDPNVSEEFKKDWKELEKTFKFTMPFTKNLHIVTPLHEQFAESFEQFMMEGKAPNKSLERLFSLARDWFTEVYKTLKNLASKISPGFENAAVSYLKGELIDNAARDVFNKMFSDISDLKEALNDEYNMDEMSGIESLNAEINNTSPIASGTDLINEADIKNYGMTPTQAKKYRKLKAEAQSYVEDKLYQKFYRKAAREKNADYIKKRKEIKAEVIKRLQNARVHRLEYFLRDNTKPDGKALGDVPIKISLEWLEANMAELTPKVVRALKRKGYVASESTNGIDPSAIASFFQYKSVVKMLQNLADSDDMNAKVNKETNIAMKALVEAGIIAKTPRSEIDALARDLIANAKRVEKVKFEYEFILEKAPALIKGITKRLIKKAARADVIKLRAEEYIKTIPLADISVTKFVAEGRRAAARAAEAWAKGDVELALKHKQEELISEYLTLFAVKAQAGFKRDSDMVRKLKETENRNKELAKTRDMKFIQAARALLSAYNVKGFTKKSPEEFLEKLKDYNHEDYVYVKDLIKDLLATAQVKLADGGDIRKELTYGEYLSFMETVHFLWAQAGESKTIGKDKTKKELNEVVSELLNQFEKTEKDQKDGINRTVTKGTKFWVNLKDTGASLERIWHVLNFLDLDNLNGPFKKYIYDPINNAYVKYKSESKKAEQRIYKLYKEKVKEIDLKKVIFAREINFEFKNKSELLAAMLHLGNPSNYEKLLLGYEWATLNEDGTLNDAKFKAFLTRMWNEGVLTKEDYLFVQELGKIMNEYKGDAQKTHAKLTGRFFKEIEIGKVELPDGTLINGWYAPVVIDKHAIENASILQDANDPKIDAEVDPDFVEDSPYTRKPGWTKERTKAHPRIDLNLDLVPNHIRSVLRYIYVKPATVDAYKIIKDKKFSDTLNRRSPNYISKIFLPAIDRADKDQIYKSEGLNKYFFVDKLLDMRQAISKGIFFTNFGNTFAQLTDVFPAIRSMNRIFKQLGISEKMFLTELISLMGQTILTTKKNKQDLDALDERMKQRDYNQMLDINRKLKSVFENPNVRKNIVDFSNANSYFMQIAVQSRLEQALYMSVFRTMIKNGRTETEAKNAAFNVINSSFGSRNPFDIANVESHKITNIATFVYSFFSNKLNLITNDLATIYHTKKDRAKLIRTVLYAQSLFMNLWAPAIAFELIARGILGKLDVDEDEEYVDEILSIVLLSGVRELAMTAPMGVGSFVTHVIDKAEGKPWADDDFGTTPVVEVPYRITNDLIDAGTGEKEPTDADVLKSTSDLLGYLVGFPGLGTATGNRLKLMKQIEDGDIDPEGMEDWMRILILGKKPPED